ncbi:MAG: hypothetical protein IPJ77_19635 [Planctomycetes bacterium]|nr:hypothetical protein [Planctomycetota bacterium]
MDPWSADVELASATDWHSVGLVLAGLGAFLIGIAVLARGHRGLVSELLGARARGLVRLREVLFQRALLVVGFLWLAAGFAFELAGHLHPVATPSFPVAWAGAILVATLALLGLAWAWALRAARAAVRQHLQRAPRDLAADMGLARELGELFGVESRPDDTVETYVERVERAAGLPERPRGAGRPQTAFDFGDDD